MDYTGHWAEKEISEAIKSGVMAGDEQGNFRPNDAVTRAEMAVILARLRKTKPPNYRYYQKGNFHVIEGAPLDIRIRLTGGRTLSNTGEMWGINGTFFNTAAPASDLSCWQIAVNQGKPIGPNAAVNGYGGVAKGTMVCYEDGRVIMSRFRNINDFPRWGNIAWAIGGNAVYPDYNLAIEKAAPDIGRHAMHTLMAYTSDKKVLLLITRRPKRLDDVVRDLRTRFNLVSAINLDGGGSTAMVANEKTIVDQGRVLNNIVYFGS